MKPNEIEQASMAIIDSEMPHPLDALLAPIIKRVIHATADFSYADTMYFSRDAVERIRGMMRRGCRVFTDTNMALAGINKKAAGRLGLRLHCLMADESVAREAERLGETRASVSMRRALEVSGEKLFVCGNAPTFLFPLVGELYREDAAVIAVPVGFVNVVEAKERVMASRYPCIVNAGRKGGSNVAAAIVNALMYGIEGVRE